MQLACISILLVIGGSRVRSTSTRAFEHSRPGVHPLWVLVAAVCLLVQLQTSLHDLIFEHERCAEHGDWVHGHDAAHDEHGTGEAASEAPEASGPVAHSSGEAEEHAHDHCAYFSSRRGGAQAVAVFVPVLAPLEGETPTPRANAGADISRGAIYAFAPKTSPPVA